jgi:hypothetical protein
MLGIPPNERQDEWYHYTHVETNVNFERTSLLSKQQTNCIIFNVEPIYIVSKGMKLCVQNENISNYVCIDLKSQWRFVFIYRSIICCWFFWFFGFFLQTTYFAGIQQPNQLPVFGSD